MNINEIISRIRRGEDSLTQFKRQSIGVAKLADEMVAFANAEGGVILFHEIDDKLILAVIVSEGVSKPHANKSGVVIPDIQFESDRDANWLKAIVKRTNTSKDADSKEPDQNPTRSSGRFFRIVQIGV